MQFGLGNLFGGGNKPSTKVVSLEEAGLIPDVFPEKFETTTVLRIKYPAWFKSSVDLKDVSSFGGTPTRGAGEISMGQVITPTQAQVAPVVGWEAEKGAYYTLVLTDPDAPSRASPSLREWVHWVRVNIPVDNLPCTARMAVLISRPMSALAPLLRLDSTGMYSSCTNKPTASRSLMILIRLPLLRTAVTSGV